MNEARHRHNFWIMNKWLCIRNRNVYIADHPGLKGRAVAVYGLGNFGKRLIEDMELKNVRPVFGVDKNAASLFAEFDIYDGSERLPFADVMVVTPTYEFASIKESVERVFDGEIISLETIVDDLWKETWERS